ncbi:lymphokine-activated killer T-cell-originated protein kinase homolog [Halyomorpha halys]|uniref:lymphokine-activated killer T-cell-originated protein kinase homolog n=1 Tax=Halyomorpha halys TaxID=286706 RepID=UPI0006D50D28|nr:lymphokine-activated killer T-cell-originated protein kinase homolog [Halyomorpha halys]
MLFVTMETPCTPPSNYKGEKTLNNGYSSPFVMPQTPCMTKLGFGTGMSVYHLHRSPRFGNERSPWAIKKRNVRAQRRIYVDKLYKEAKILCSLDHPNIVGFRGFMITPDGREVLLMEECTQSLGDYIENFSQDCGAFSPTTIYQVIASVSSALQYLHEDQELIHGDIKSFNILIKGKLEFIKLCDFGVSLNIGEDGISDEEYVGTLPWTAPEALEDGLITEKVDIFAFGLTIYEMLALKLPHWEFDDTYLMDSTFESDMLDDSIEKPYGTRPELPSLGSEYKDIVALFNWCTEEDYIKRPRARDMLNTLHNKHLNKQF